jgi:hypothetical protein
MRIAAFAVVYFLAVFAVGFVLGTLRVTLVVPAVGAPAAELAEIPFMVAVIVFLAWRLVRRWRLGIGSAVAGGVIALVLLLGAEFALVGIVRGLTIEQWVASRANVAGAVYAAALAVFMLAPAGAACRLRGQA